MAGLRLLDDCFTPEWLPLHPSDRLLVEARSERATAETRPR